MRPLPGISRKRRGGLWKGAWGVLADRPPAKRVPPHLSLWQPWPLATMIMSRGSVLQDVLMTGYRTVKSVRTMVRSTVADKLQAEEALHAQIGWRLLESPTQSG